MDNASFHRTTQVVNLLSKRFKRILFITPLSPALNMIEYLFAVLKQKLKNENNIKECKFGKDFEETIIRTINTINKEDITKV